MSSARNTKTQGNGAAKADAYQIITDRILQKMEGGLIPWQKPWHSLGAPRNYVTQHVYTGINSFLLHIFTEPGQLPVFMTFNQAKKLGGHIRAGAKGFPVMYAGVTEKEKQADQSGEAKTERRSFAKHYTVFNVADVEGVNLILPEVVASQFEPVEAAEAIVLSWAERPAIKHMDQRAYYVPALDYVNMPIFSSFTSAEGYYKTLFHELTHATGHQSRLFRADLADNMATKGAAGYAREELTAEMGAAFLCGAAGISPEATDDNTAAYLQYWIGVLKNDKKLLIQAGSHAQKAANLILGYHPGGEPEPEPAPAPQPDHLAATVRQLPQPEQDVSHVEAA